jgi:hypothetical protein
MLPLSFSILFLSVFQFHPGCTFLPGTLKI